MSVTTQGSKQGLARAKRGSCCASSTRLVSFILLGCFCIANAKTDEVCPLELDLSHVDPEVEQGIVSLRETTNVENAEHVGRLGMAYEMNGFPMAAQGCYKSAENLQPENPSWPYYQALLAAARGETPKAIESALRSKELDPNYAPVSLWLGHWYLEIDELEAARKAFLDARHANADIPSRIGLARVFLRNERAKEVLETLKPVVEYEVHPYVAGLLGRAHRLLGDETKSLQFLRQVSDAGIPGWYDPRSFEKQQFSFSISAQLANIRTQLKTPLNPKTLTESERLLSRYPRHRGVLVTAIEANRLAEKSDRMVELLRKGLQEHPDFGLLHQWLAEHLVSQGRFDLAQHHLDSAANLGHANSRMQVFNGILQLQLGRTEEAIRFFESATKFHPPDVLSYLYLGLIDYERGRLNSAQSYLNRAVELNPTLVEAHLALARVFASLNQEDRAASHLKAAEALGMDVRDFQLIQPHRTNTPGFE